MIGGQRYRMNGMCAVFMLVGVGAMANDAI